MIEYQLQNNHLKIDDCDMVTLAEKYGTPLYVLSKTHVKKAIEELKEAFTNKYPGTRIAYAAKAFLTVGFATFLNEMGLCMDVVSGGELYTARQGGFPAENIEFNGNNKLEWEIDYAVKEGVGRIIIDGKEELTHLIAAAKKYKKKQKVLIRLTPGVSASTHDYIVTGRKDSKFGFPLDSQELEQTLTQAIEAEEIHFMGFHFHIGSQLFEREGYMESLEVVLDYMRGVIQKHSISIEELNIGGGFGIRYTEEDDPKPFSYFITPMMERIQDFCKDQKMPMMQVVCEPGRSIVGEAGVTLYTVGSIKEVAGIRTFVTVDGGMTDNIRPALYQAKYHGMVANKAEEKPVETVSIVGKCCESGDVIIENIKLPKIQRGDTLCIFSTGAYGYTMASNYNKIPTPAVVWVEEAKSEVLVRRQSLEDLIRNE